MSIDQGKDLHDALKRPTRPAQSRALALGEALATGDRDALKAVARESEAKRATARDAAHQAGRRVAGLNDQVTKPSTRSPGERLWDSQKRNFGDPVE